jgi:type IV pilus assembly protein PilA
LRAKVSEGLILAGGVKTAIAETFLSKGFSDMSCTDTATCGAIGATFPPKTSNLNSITSAANGTITITFNSGLLGSANVLVLAPWDGSLATPAPVDLNAAPTGARPGIVWKCGWQATGSVPTTSVLPKYLPANCR